WKSFVVELAGGFGIERQFELVFPAKFEARFGNGVVTVLRAGMVFGQIGGVRGDFVGDDAVLDILFVRQTEMFFRRDVAKHGATVPSDHGRADRAGAVIVAVLAVGGDRTQCVGGRFVAELGVFLHV